MEEVAVEGLAFLTVGLLLKVTDDLGDAVDEVAADRETSGFVQLGDVFNGGVVGFHWTPEGLETDAVVVFQSGAAGSV